MRIYCLQENLKVAWPSQKNRGLPIGSAPNLRTVALIGGACLLTSFVVPIWASGEWQILQQRGTDLIQMSSTTSGRHKLEINDAFGFRTPVATQTFTGSSFELHGNDFALIPGVDYHIRFDGGPAIRDFRLVSGPSFTEPEVNCSMLRQTWEATGRLKTGVAFSAVRWQPGRGWVPIPHSYLIGQSLYNVELYLQPAINSAWACQDLETLDEVAQYFLAMLEQTMPVGNLLSRPNVTAESRDRLASVDPSARTFIATFGDQVGEGEPITPNGSTPLQDFCG